MALVFPLSTPTTIGIASIELTATNAVAVSRSPFTFSQQVHTYPGQMWSASVTIPPLRKEFVEPWVAMLLGLRGQTGTFLLGDPNNVAPRGTATSATVSGSSGDSSVTVTMTGTLLAGDYIQLGAGADATLHKVLLDKTDSGTLEIWPALRKDRTTVAATLTNARGVFRLATNQQSWSINDSSAYGLQFDCMEAI
jgi:hypothetical protein